MLTKKQENKIYETVEELGWHLDWDNDSFSFQRYSNAGEDFWIECNANNLDELKHELQEYYYWFDPEKHAAMWYGANKGEPSSLRALLDDADAIDKNIEQLAMNIAKIN